MELVRKAIRLVPSILTAILLFLESNVKKKKDILQRQNVRSVEDMKLKAALSLYTPRRLMGEWGISPAFLNLNVILGRAVIL